MTWTQFHDMHSGGGNKEPWERIYIEAPENEAKVIFYNRFGHNPERVTCTCCGDDYSISEEPSLARASAWERGCSSLETPRNAVTRLYEPPDDPWWKEHYWLEPDEHDEARERGWKISEPFASQPPYRTVAEYEADPKVMVIRADQIKDEERTGTVPEQGYVWAG